MFGGKIMDSFMDKIAQKLQTSDVIKANSEAEAKQLNAYKSRVEELDKAVEDMRRLCLKCVETNEATGQFVQEAIEKIDAIKTESEVLNPEELEKLTKGLEELQNTIKASFDEAHKDSLRVYRNVQASVVEELKQQTEALSIQHAQIEKKGKGIRSVMITTLVMSILSVGLLVAMGIYMFVPLG